MGRFLSSGASNLQNNVSLGPRCNQPSEDSCLFLGLIFIDLRSPAEGLARGDRNCRAGFLESQQWTGLVLPDQVNDKADLKSARITFPAELIQDRNDSSTIPKLSILPPQLHETKA
jgi:hypothetical protein